VEFNRSLGLYRPVNISSIIVSSAFTKMDEYDCAETSVEKDTICDFLVKILPSLKTLILEELLSERMSLSGMVVLSYELMTEKLCKNGKKGIGTNLIPPQVMHELMQIRDSALPGFEQQNAVADDDEDMNISCSLCKYILFNSRRSCQYCKGFDFCEPCFSAVGRNHQHKLRKHRKNSLNSLLELVESMKKIIEEREYSTEENEIPRQLVNSQNQNQIVKDSRELRNLVPTGNPEKLESKISRKRTLRDLKDVKYKPEATEDELKSTKEYLELMVDQPPQTTQQTQQMPGQLPGPPANEPYDEEVIDCVCGNNKDLGFMISCEKCFAWLHGKCVGISKRNEPDQYYCPRCVKKYGITPRPPKTEGKDF